MPLLLYRFRYRDQVTGRWVTARYRAELHEIARRYATTEWEVVGEPEVREPLPDSMPDSFNPYRKPGEI